MKNSKIVNILLRLRVLTRTKELTWYKVDNSYVTFIGPLTVTLDPKLGEVLINFTYKTFSNSYWPDLYTYRPYIRELWDLVQDSRYKPSIEEADFIKLIESTINKETE